jgi:hypothetical protein
MAMMAILFSDEKLINLKSGINSPIKQTFSAYIINLIDFNSNDNKTAFNRKAQFTKQTAFFPEQN